jgi:hypothetical protein
LLIFNAILMKQLAKFYIACRIGAMYNVLNKHISFYINGRNVKFKLPKKIGANISVYMSTYKTFINKLVKRITRKLIDNKKQLLVKDVHGNTMRIKSLSLN